VIIDYKALRSVNQATARRAVLEYLASVKGNVAATARAFGITRPVVYDILAKAHSGDQQDRPKTTQTPAQEDAS
jgi:transposase-like protein